MSSFGERRDKKCFIKGGKKRLSWEFLAAEPEFSGGVAAGGRLCSGGGKPGGSSIGTAF